ncbi:MAG: tRNA-dihydrouridine synthase family protein [Fibrobacter sp.]|jgi:tRNA-dihydrouridine synthase B|nr:tRNA-dihydrouridine synthase family protein [Fibrobacter sp.]
MTSDHIFYLAPIRGITDHIFRNTFEKFFARFDFQITPFIPTVKGSFVNPCILRDIDPSYNDIKRVVPQIIGNSPQEIKVLANKICELGYSTVNLNFGCPHAPVTKKKRGAGILPYPDMIRSILDQLPFQNCSFSVKIRLGLENENDIEKTIPLFNEYPLSEVIIHPRTGIQMYKGSVNLDAFQRCLSLSRHILVFNGDIFSSEDFIHKQKLFPQINRWMLGRGVLYNPFLLGILRGQNPDCNITYLRNFHDEIMEQSSQILSGPSHLLGKMKGLWTYMASSLVDGKRILKKIQKTSSLKNYNELIDRLFNDQLTVQSSEAVSLR